MSKTSENVFLAHLREWVFHVFVSFHLIMVGVPKYLVDDHFTIFNSSYMQHLRCGSLKQKIGESWKLLLTVVTLSLILNDSETHR